MTPEADRLVLRIEIEPELEGYAPNDDADIPDDELRIFTPVRGYLLHGQIPLRNGGFSFRYRVVGPDGFSVASLALAIDDATAVALESLLCSRHLSMGSSTTWCDRVFLSDIVGDYPIISIPDRGIAFVLGRYEDLGTLARLLGTYLDRAPLTDALRERRLALRDERSRGCG